MSPTEKSDKREQLLLSAEELFAEKGFDGTSVRDIAQHADVNLAMISYYFGSKEKLLKALIEMRFSSTELLLEEMNRESLGPMEKVVRLVAFYVNKIIGNYRFHNIMHQEYNTDRSLEIKELITTIKLKHFEEIKKIIEEGYKKKIFKKVDPEMVMATVMGTIHQVINAKNIYCNLLQIDATDDAAYRQILIDRVTPHLQQLVRDHLLIK